MTRTRRQREDSVWRWVEAARTISKRRDLHTWAIAQSAQLSPEGVDLALDHALEIDPSQAEVELLVASTTEASSVTIVLSANVFTAPLRAIALAKAAAETVVVKPSRRDPLFTRLLSEYARDPHVSLVNKIDFKDTKAAEIHAYGNDTTLRAIAGELPTNIAFRAHGSGFGIAYIDPNAPIGEAAQALSRDIVLFDQRGCLSPRIAFVLGGAAHAEAFANALSDALAPWSVRVPRGPLHDEARAEIRQYLDAMHMSGLLLEASDHAVACSNHVALPPAFRIVQVVHANTPEAIGASLGSLGSFVTTVGCHGDPPEMRSLALLRRRAALGMMQSPSFDGPVDPRRWPPSTLT